MSSYTEEKWVVSNKCNDEVWIETEDGSTWIAKTVRGPIAHRIAALPAMEAVLREIERAVAETGSKTTVKEFQAVALRVLLAARQAPSNPWGKNDQG